jgi:murein DD-endopeptidase MepM/ murein hydrolase activator NlpD
MWEVAEMLRSRIFPRAAVLVVVTASVAACSADTLRFNDNPFSRPEATASIPQAQTAQAAPPSPGRSTSAAANSGGAGGKALVLNTPSRARPGAPEATGSGVRKSSATWSWEGGTAITVAAGDTVDTIARRYGVPASAIMQANNIAAPATIHPGQRLVIPRYNAPRVATTPASAPRPAGDAGVHVVGDRLIIPGAQAAAVKANAPAAAAQPKSVVASAAPKEAEPVQSASVVAPTDPLDKEAAKLADGAGAVPNFRWPANGRVIAGYGTTTNGQQNDGINIALPENTPVKAAEDGVVAYAGNELKGHGNLVLVRHPNGYVTAYAHAKELLVKRGDQVKRGQVLARSGQTGNVNAPQLHFEIRKGSSPLDPTRFLNGA